MSTPTKRLLHVEDDVMQQRVIAHHLKSLAEVDFEIVTVESEDRALEAFQSAKFDLVILDFQLAQGDGLHVLNRLRQLDPIVPIIAVSGIATAEIAAELVKAGADDYFDKRRLDSAGLAKAIRAVLLRADTLSKTLAKPRATFHDVEKQLLELCRMYVERLGTAPLQMFAVMEGKLRQTKLDADEFEKLYDSICTQVEAQQQIESSRVRVLLRPLFLDLLFRLDREPESSHHLVKIP